MAREKICGVYKILNKVNFKFYIGSSVDIYKRWETHRLGLNSNSHQNEYLQNSWNKYKEENFEFLILESIQVKEYNDVDKLKNALLSLEQKYLDTTKCYDRKIGYNISPTAGSPLGVKHTEKTKEKFREVQLKKGTNKPILQINLNGEVIRRWNGVKEASKTLGISYGSISGCIKHKENYYTAYNYIWVYEDEYVNLGLDLNYYLNNKFEVNKIVKLDKSFDLIDTYSDINDVICNNKQYKKQNVYDSITRKGEAYGFYWLYEKDFLNIKDFIQYYNHYDGVVYQCNEHFNIIKKWLNIYKVNKELNLNIKITNKNKYVVADNYIWTNNLFYERVREKETKKILKKENNDKIMQFDLNGCVVKVWNDRFEIKNILPDINIKYLNSYLKNTKGTYKKFIWIKESDYDPQVIKNIINNVPNGIKVVQVDMNNNFIKEWNSLAQVKEDGFDSHSVRSCCNGLSPSHRNYKWLYLDDYKNENYNIFKGYKFPSIVQLDLNGKYIKTWDGVYEIIKQLKLDRTSIYNCCVGITSSSGGYQWLYETDFLNGNFEYYKNKQNKKYKPIVQLDLEGNFIKEWLGSKEASVKLNIFATGITSCCKGKCNKAYGYIWKYLEEYNNQIKD